MQNVARKTIRMVMKIARTVAPPAHVVALLLAVCATGSAWAATVTTDGNVGDDVTVVNSSGNAGGYSWNNSASIKLKVPVSNSLGRGALVEITSVEFVDIGTTTSSGVKYCTPSSMTIMGCTATKNTDTSYDTSVFGTHNSAGSWKFAKYSFAEGSRPIMTVGVSEYVSFEFPDGYTNLRALPTNQNADNDDQVVSLNTSGYSPCTRIKGKVVAPTPYTATPTSSSVNISEIEWTRSKEGNDEAGANYIIDATNLTTLNLDESFAANTIFIDKSSSGTITINQSNSSTLSATNIVISTGLVVNFGANTSLSVVGGTVAGSNEIGMNANCTFNFQNVYCPAKLNVRGTLNARGNTYFTAANPFQVGCKLNVVDGVTELTNRTGDSNGFSGNIDIAEGAKLTIKTTDGLAYNRANTIDVHGTLEFGGQRWTIGTGNTINLHNNGLIKGAGDANGAMFYNVGDGTINVDGNSTIESVINVRGNTLTLNIAEGKTLTWSGGSKSTAGGIKKTGLGTLDVTAATSYTGATTVTQGMMIQTSLPSGNVSIEEGATFRLNAEWDDSPDKFSGDGTLQLFNDSTSSHKNHDVIGATFGGVLDFVCTGDHGHVLKSAGFLSSAEPIIRPQWSVNTTGSGTYADSYAHLFFDTVFNGTTLKVRDLTGAGSVCAKFSGAAANTITIESQQTKNTVFSGNLLCNDGEGEEKHIINLSVVGDGTGNLHSLTLSNANTSIGEMTISDEAKVVFSENGSWAKGTITVADDGVLESQNSAAIAAMLKVEEGATLVFADGVQLAATEYDWSSVSTDGSVYVDLSAVTPSDTPVTLIASDVTVTKDKFYVTAAQRTATLSVEDGALKATFSNNWHDGVWGGTPVAGDDATLYISQNSTLNVSEALSLGTVTVVKEGDGNVELTISGAGALTTGGWTIPAGVTVNTPTTMTISGDVSGDGVINVPANTTLAMDGVTCSTKVTIEGTLETSGATMLSAANTSAAGSLIHVVGGKTVLSTASKGIKGNITIDSTAELQSDSSHDGVYRYQHIDYNGSSCIDIAGKLNMDNCAWFLGVKNVIKLRNGANVTGYGRDGNNYGNWAWVGEGKIEAYGDSTLDITINTASGVSPVLTISQDATLKITKAFTPQNGSYYAGGSITKAGAGTLQFTQETLTKPITINEGKVQLRRAFTSGLAISIASGAELELGVGHGNTDINATDISFAGVTGTGTIRFSSSHTGYYTLPSSAANMFATTLHVANDNTGNGLVIPWSGGVTTNRLLTAAGKYRTDWSGTKDVADRYFLALQDCDATWSGVFHQNDRLHGMKVAGVESAEHKTLTLSGIQEHTNTLEVEPSGSVNLTGTWVGDTTVDGEFGGTGTLTGNFTLNAGSTFKVWATDANGLSVTGALTLPANNGTVTVDVSGLTLGANESYPILAVGSGLSNTSPFAELDSETHMLSVSSGTLSVVPIAATVTSGTSVQKCSSVDAAIGTMVYSSNKDAYVTVINGTTELTNEQLAEHNIVYDSSDSTYRIAAAQIGSTNYGTLSAAVAAAAASGDTVTLLRNTAEQNVDVSDKEITLVEGEYTFSGTFTGNGTVVLNAALKSPDAAARWASGWRGSVKLNFAPSSPITLNSYGIDGSTVIVTSASGYLKNEKVLPTIELEGTFAITGFSPSFNNTLTKLTGGGTFSMSVEASAGNDLANVAGWTGTVGKSHYSAYILINDVSEFTGSFTLNNANTGFAIGDTRLTSTTPGGYIRVAADEEATIGATATWTAPNGYIVDGELSCEKGGKFYGTGADGTLALGGSGTIVNNFEGGSAQCFNAGAITVSDSLLVKMVGCWSNFGTWTLTGTSSLAFDPGTDDNIRLNSTITSAAKENTIHVYGLVVDNVEDGTKDAAIHIHDGGTFQVGTESGQNDYLQYDNKNDVGTITIDAGGTMKLFSRETYTRNTTLAGGTIQLAGVQSYRSIDFYNGPTITVTADSTIESTVTGDHWIYLRGAATTFDVANGKTLTVNAGFKNAGEGTQDLIKTGAGTMIVNGYVDGEGTHQEFSQCKGVDIRAGVYELNAVQTTGNSGDAYTVAAGAKLKVGATGKANTTTLELVDGSLLEFGSVEAAKIVTSATTLASGTASVGFSTGVTPVAGAKLISWGGAPEGSFVAEDCTLVKKSDGLYIGGGVDDGTAVVEDTEGVVTIPSGATAVSLAITGGSASLVSTTPLVVNGGGKNVTVYATDADGQKTSTDISSAFKVTPGENDTYTIELNEEVVQKNVTPTTFAEGGTPTLSMTAIPGLWYQVVTGTSMSGTELAGTKEAGTAVQATEATVSPAAPAFTGTVKFYKIAVGASKAALQ